MASCLHILLHPRLPRHPHLHQRHNLIHHHHHHLFHHFIYFHHHPFAFLRHQHPPPLCLKIQWHLPHVPLRSQNHLRRASKVSVTVQLPRLRPHPRDPPLESPQPQRKNGFHRWKPVLRRVFRRKAPRNRCLRRAVYDQKKRDEGADCLG